MGPASYPIPFLNFCAIPSTSLNPSDLITVFLLSSAPVHYQSTTSSQLGFFHSCSEFCTNTLISRAELDLPKRTHPPPAAATSQLSQLPIHHTRHSASH